MTKRISLPQLYLRISLAFLGITPPFAALAQTNAPAPLPPAAQEALNKGIIAAKVPDYPLAIRFFEDARKIAHEAPVIFLNFGIAESKMPGRELRAIAWFGAYLAAFPDAPNAAAVKEQIAVLDVRNQSNVSRLIKTVQAAAIQRSGYKKRDGLWAVGELWAKTGDIAAALKTADLNDDQDRSYARYAISKVQAEDGDIAGAQKTAELVRDAVQAVYARSAIANAQQKSGDIAGVQKTLASAQKSADLIKEKGLKDRAQQIIAEVQAKSGDIAGAQKTANLIRDALDKSRTLLAIAISQIEAGDIAGAQSTLTAALRTADLIEVVRANESKLGSSKSEVQQDIAYAQLRTGDIAGAQRTVDLIQDAYYKNGVQGSVTTARTEHRVADAPRSTSDTQPPIQRIPKVFDWLVELGIDYFGNIYSSNLNDPVFLDLAGHLKSLNSSLESKVAGENSQMEIFRRKEAQIIFDDLDATAKQMVKAQNDIHRLLKQQAIR
jgi:hypothetical protein